MRFIYKAVFTPCHPAIHESTKQNVTKEPFKIALISFAIAIYFPKQCMTHAILSLYLLSKINTKVLI